MKIGWVASVKPSHPYLENDPAPLFDLHYLRILPWLWFSVAVYRRWLPCLNGQVSAGFRQGGEPGERQCHPAAVRAAPPPPGESVVPPRVRPGLPVDVRHPTPPAPFLCKIGMYQLFNAFDTYMVRKERVSETGGGTGIFRRLRLCRILVGRRR